MIERRPSKLCLMTGKETIQGMCIFVRARVPEGSRRVSTVSSILRERSDVDIVNCVILAASRSNPRAFPAYILREHRAEHVVVCVFTMRATSEVHDVDQCLLC
jgi:hypothetical protein